MTDAAVSFEDVSYFFPGGHRVFEAFDFRIRRGESLLVCGTSGSGKSTFLRMINGLVPNFSGGSFKGHVVSLGFDTRDATTRQISRKVGFVFQDPENQFVMDDVLAEAVFYAENLGMEKEEIISSAEEVFEKLGIKDLLQRKVGSLSCGQKQKVALASALISKPELLVLDEPTSQLDPASANDFLSHLFKIKDRDMTVVISEHRIEKVADYVDRVLDLDRLKSGGLAETLSKSKVAPSYVGLAKMLRGRGFDMPAVGTLSEAKDAMSKIRLKPVRRKPARFSKDPVITFEGVGKRLGGTQALSDISCEIFAGEFIAVVGENGCGKTTFARHLNGLYAPDTGRVTVFGVDTSESVVEDLAAVVGYVPQNPSDYLVSESVEKELRFSLNCQGKTSDVGETLDFMGLSDLAQRHPRDLSQGQKQLVAIASVLVCDPDVLVLDEPTRGVDRPTKSAIFQKLSEIRSKGTTIVVVTHDMDLASAFSSRMLLLEASRLKAQGNPRSVLSRQRSFWPTTFKLFPDKKPLSEKEARKWL